MQFFSEEAEKRRKKRRILYIWMLIAVFVLLVAATYTWFSLSQSPRVTDMALYVNAPHGLELATYYNASDDKWTQSLDFLDLIDESAPLKPITWSKRRDTFLTMYYGLDGRMTGQYTPLNDDINANTASSNGYYVIGTVYARSGEPCSVSLAEAAEINEGKNGSGTYVIGMPIWNSRQVKHTNGGGGGECTIRIGFRIQSIDKTNGQPTGDSEFYIYEPNSDVHNVENLKGYVRTPSVDGGLDLTDNKYIITQTMSSWTEADPVQRDVTIKSLGKFTSDTSLFRLEAGEIKRIMIYFWMEGQDIDCTNAIQESFIIASIQFSTSYDSHSGMQTIPGGEDQTQTGQDVHDNRDGLKNGSLNGNNRDGTKNDNNGNNGTNDDTVHDNRDGTKSGSLNGNNRDDTKNVGANNNQ